MQFLKYNSFFFISYLLSEQANVNQPRHIKKYVQAKIVFAYFQI